MISEEKHDFIDPILNTPMQIVIDAHEKTCKIIHVINLEYN